ncbi:MAG: tetratricopeptide repeat protein [Caldimicrobium sp.]|nr:tetratricopeptide repeat protein [Caldimicrobium sp.]MDW8094780.1 hypothetical protein [Caldimicrobium sp.]
MEEDRLLRFHEKLKDFLQKHLTFLLNVVLVFLILILISGAWIYYQKNKERKAFEELTKIIHKGGEVKALQDFVKKYGNTPAGIQGWLILWNTYLQGEDIQNLKQVITPMKRIYKDKAANLPLYAEAKILEASAKWEEAMKVYQKIYNDDPILRRMILFDLARLKERENKREAIKFYRELLGDSKESYLKGFVEFKLYSLQES